MIVHDNIALFGRSFFFSFPVCINIIIMSNSYAIVRKYYKIEPGFQVDNLKYFSITFQGEIQYHDKNNFCLLVR